MEKLQQLAELKRQVADAQSHGVELLTEAIGTPAEQLPLEREYARSVARGPRNTSPGRRTRVIKSGRWKPPSATDTVWMC